MSKSQLEQIKAFTKIVADTGDIQSIERFRPQDATTNPSLIQAAAKMPAYSEIVIGAVRAAEKALGASAKPEAVIALAVDRLSIEFGLRILDIVPGRVSTEVDARLSFDTAKTLDKARTLISMYEAAGASRERILIKIASTWEGIRAAEVLEKEGIHCNLTLLFGLHQAIACAEAGVTLISPFVGRILDFYKKKTGREEYPPAEDPGVLSVTEIFHYFKKHGHPTQVMGASFRNKGEILELAGCDLLTIAPKLLAELDASDETVPRKLDPAVSERMEIPKIHVDEATFRKMHAADEMATFKLQEGIDGFTSSLVGLEAQLRGLLGGADSQTVSAE